VQLEKATKYNNTYKKARMSSTSTLYNQPQNYFCCKGVPSFATISKVEKNADIERSFLDWELVLALTLA